MPWRQDPLLVNSCWSSSASWLTVIRSQQLNSHVFTEAGPFIFKGLHPSGCSVSCSRPAGGSWASTWVLPGGRHYGSSAWGLSPRFTKWWLAGFTHRFASLPADLAGGRLANTLVGDPRRSKTEVLEDVFLDDVTFVLDLTSRCFWVKVTDDPAILLACLIAPTQFWRTLGSGPSTWEPSNGSVLTEDRTWGWNPKFFSRASRRSNWRFDAAAKPADTVDTWASWIMASFSLRSFVRLSLGESSSITDATMESAREA